ncbi:hypothetical protein [Ramlibacter sp.]|uniref:hypothetical protein n=1 Tax=Ramlibacter sp. TaxID=1917967 RepID=UPI002FCA3CCE
MRIIYRDQLKLGGALKNVFQFRNSVGEHKLGGLSCVLVLALFSIGCSVQPERTVIGGPVPRIALPEEYPAKNDSREELMRRLLRLAESSHPQLKDVERDFGVRFIDGWAQGRPPLGSKRSRSSGDKELRTLLLSFENAQTQLEIRQLRQPSVNICIDANAIARAFLTSDWRVRPRIRGGHSDGAEQTFAKKIGGHFREVTLAPVRSGFASEGVGDCLVLAHFFFTQ